MLAEQLLNGVIVGGLYALVALGYTLVFGVLDKLNFAHPDIFMFGGYVAVASLVLGAPVWAAVAVVAAVTGVLGLMVEIASFRRFTSPDAHITAALSSVAFGLVIVDLVQKQWGSEPLAIPLEGRGAAIVVFDVRLALVKLAALAATLVLLAVLYVVVSRTRFGRHMRAVADSPVSAALLGINVRWVTQQVFFLASALAGVAGMLRVTITGFATSEVGFTFGLKALAIMAIGGMGDLRGAVLGGILVGMVESVAFQIGLGQVADVAVWVLMIAVLLVRPAGLFGGRHQREIRA
ncbi:MAG: branched-chain amino acid ABC transporter permease [Acidobacteriota bacterium]